LPNPAGWKIRRKVASTAPVMATQVEFVEDRPLDAALASVARENLTVSDHIARLRRAVDAAANSHAPPCEPANSQPSLAQLSSAQALGCAQAKPKAQLSSQDVATELRRRIGDPAWHKYREWQDLVQREPGYVAGILRYASAVEAETGRAIRSMGGYLSRIARDDGKWHLQERSSSPTETQTA
jgi:hypothetical protein